MQHLVKSTREEKTDCTTGNAEVIEQNNENVLFLEKKIERKKK